MNNVLAADGYIPAIFWIGHLAVALIGLVLLRSRAGQIPSTRRVAYFATGGILVLVGLLPAAFASTITVALALGVMALANVPIGVPMATALACALGLLIVFAVVNLVVRATVLMFVRIGLQPEVASPP